MKASEMLQKAHDLIEQNGWCQEEWARDEKGAAISGDGTKPAIFCVLGALWSVDGNERDTALEMKAEDYIIKEIGERSISAWNDDPSRTEGDVLDVLRFATKRAREDELLGVTP